jgi:phosphoribosylamine--glycine ligase
VKKGRKVTVPAELPDGVVLFHAGTSVLMEDVVTSGGRVLGVSATASDLSAARKAAYAAAEKIEFTGKHYRTDIGA